MQQVHVRCVADHLGRKHVRLMPVGSKRAHCCSRATVGISRCLYRRGRTVPRKFSYPRTQMEDNEEKTITGVPPRTHVRRREYKGAVHPNLLHITAPNRIRAAAHPATIPTPRASPQTAPPSIPSTVAAPLSRDAPLSARAQ